ncbi:tRNA 2-thiocytidine(32) synthetase TtcA, partial [Paraburkholderia sp. SIMBA_049]
DKRFPGRVDNMFSALANVVPSHLMDTTQFPFGSLRATGQADPQGDIAFDEEPCASGEDTAARDGARPISIVQFDDL